MHDRDGTQSRPSGPLAVPRLWTDSLDVALDAVAGQAQRVASSATPLQTSALLDTTDLRISLSQALDTAYGCLNTWRSSDGDDLRALAERMHLDELGQDPDVPSEVSHESPTLAPRLVGTSDADTAARDVLDGIPFEIDGQATKPLHKSDFLLKSTLDASDVPELDGSLLDSVSRALGFDSRDLMSQHAGVISVSKRRWILASLLNHYLGHAFGQHVLPSGQVRYAIEDPDDVAVRAYFSRARRQPVVGDPEPASASTVYSFPSEQQHPDTPTTVSTSVDQESAHRRRQEKLAKIFGEPVPLLKPNKVASAGNVNPQATRLVAREAGASLSSSHWRSYSHFTPIRVSELEGSGTADPHRDAAYSAFPASPHRRAFSAGTSSTAPAGQIDSDRISAQRLHKTDAARTIDVSMTAIGNNSPDNPRYHRASLDDAASLDSFHIASGSAWSRPETSHLALHRIESSSTLDSQSRLLPDRVYAQSAALDRWTRHPGDSALHTGQIRYDQSVSESTPRSPPPFSSTHLARVQASAGRGPAPDVPELPPTLNLLSSQEKQSLVRQNRKLRAVLGSDLNEQDIRALPAKVVRDLDKVEGGGNEQTGQERASVDVKNEEEEEVIVIGSQNGPLSSAGYAESSDMSRLATSASGGLPGEAGSGTDTFTSPDMGAKSPETDVHLLTKQSDDGATLWSPGTAGSSSPATSPSKRHGPSFADAQSKQARRRKLMKVYVDFDILCAQPQPPPVPATA